MIVGPAIEALQGDPSLQRNAQLAVIKAFGEWRAERSVASILAGLDRYGEGASLGTCPALAGLFEAGGGAQDLVDGLNSLLCGIMRQEPITLPPMRHSHGGGRSTLLLARTGRAQLILEAIDPGIFEHTTVQFSDAEQREIVLAGAGLARRITRSNGGDDPALLADERVTLAPAQTFSLDLSSESLQLTEVTRPLVRLRLHRFAADPRPSQQYSLGDGRMVSQSAGDLHTSRKEMMVALLGRLQRTEAAPLLAEIAAEPGDASLRWQALRECLALDTATGFSSLSRLASRSEDPLANAARAMREQLVSSHPELREWEQNECLV